MSKTCIIVGASHAAAQLVASLYQEGWGGEIIVIGDEAQLPYNRPPLSKTFLSGDKTAEQLLIRPQAAYDKTGAKFLLNKRVINIDREAKIIRLDDQQELSYDKLAICTGARVRTAPIPGSALPGVCYLRTIADVERIKQYTHSRAKAVIVGGGYIGLETAASLSKLGMQVTVLEMAKRVLERVTSPEMSAFFTRVHQEEGVDIKTNVCVSKIIGDDKVEAVECADGSRIPADLIVIGIGIIPNTELAESAGITVENGIVTDEFATTNDPDIVACGDCANHPNKLYGRSIRLESVPNATEQAKSAAAAICDKQKAYSALPWFWSDQYDIKLQIVGLNQGYDQTIIRGDIEKDRDFAIFYLKDGILIAADCVNRVKEFTLAKKLVLNKTKVSPERFADESLKMDQIVF
jgi:3-phenylpropionate/trans-cinnamate dioxygenase ferredoxin reductase subunit